MSIKPVLMSLSIHKYQTAESSSSMSIKNYFKTHPLKNFSSASMIHKINPKSLLRISNGKSRKQGYEWLHITHSSGERLTTVFVYVPHFSTHTISIKSLTSGIAAVSNVILPIILSVLFICLSIGGIIVKKRKQQDDF